MAGLIWFVIIIIVCINIAKNKANLTNNTKDLSKTQNQDYPLPTHINTTTSTKTGTNAKKTQNSGRKMTQSEINAKKEEIRRGLNNANESILEKAKKNTDIYVDDVLHDVQCASENDKHMMHAAPKEPIEAATSLKDIEDLMIKGYSGNLEFERDFLGEAMDMLNSYTM